MVLGKKRVMDIASDLKISSGTVQKYLNADPTLNEGNRLLIDQYVDQKERALNPGKKAVAG